MGSSTLGDVNAMVDRVRRRYDDECFACGRDNPLGLALDNFKRSDNEVSATFVPRPQFRGTTSVLHGGITATALDEMLVWAAILTHGVMAVTGTFDLRYRKPVPMGQELTVRARVDDRRGRRLQCSGELLNADAIVMTSATGVYLVTEDVGPLLT